MAESNFSYLQKEYPILFNLAPQDLNDEPAIVLLERIKAEKEGKSYKLPKNEVLQAAEPEIDKL
jgi:hypothetical protein